MEKQIKIGLVIADSDEFLPLEKKAEQLNAVPVTVAGRRALKFTARNAEVTAVLCGIGKVNAAVAATALAERGADILLNCGLSGGISGVARGQLTIPNRFLEHDFDLSGIGYKLCEKPGQEYIYSADEKLLAALLKIVPAAAVGTAVCGDCFVSDAQLRDKLKAEFSAMSCDMETAAIASVAHFYSLPFLALRKVSDDAGNDAGADYRELNILAEDVLITAILELICSL